jgi:hypothetical protein
MRHTQPTPKVQSAGCIIDTGDDLSHNIDELVKAINTLHVDIVVVLDDERLTSMLRKQTFVENVTVVRVPKSTGAVALTADEAHNIRTLKYKQYFYGHPGEGKLAPSMGTARLQQVSLFSTVNDALAPSSALPLGASALLRHDRLKAVTGDDITVNSIIAITAATRASDVGSASTLGFLHVKDCDGKMVQFLSPCAGPLPGVDASGHSRWMIGKNQWFDH